MQTPITKENILASFPEFQHRQKALDAMINNFSLCRRTMRMLQSIHDISHHMSLGYLDSKYAESKRHLIAMEAEESLQNIEVSIWVELHGVLRNTFKNSYNRILIAQGKRTLPMRDHMDTHWPQSKKKATGIPNRTGEFELL